MLACRARNDARQRLTRPSGLGFASAPQHERPLTTQHTRGHRLRRNRDPECCSAADCNDVTLPSSQCAIWQLLISHIVVPFPRPHLTASEGTNRISAGALYQLEITLEVPVQYFFDG